MMPLMSLISFSQVDTLAVRAVIVELIEDTLSSILAFMVATSVAS